jgi:hypothetical protein
MLHYIPDIQTFGTTDNYNTEMFERLHIDFAKKGWRASNKRDETPQMIEWLNRQEKVAAFERILELSKETEVARAAEAQEEKRRKFVELVNNSQEVFNQAMGKLALREDNRRIIIAKHPSIQPIYLVESAQPCPTLSSSLTTFLVQCQGLPASEAATFILPFKNIKVYKQFKLVQERIQEDDEERVYTIKANQSCCDTVLVLNTDRAQSTGLQGESSNSVYALVFKVITGCRVGRIRAIFRLPPKTSHGLAHHYPTYPLAHLEWYTKLKPVPGHDHDMYHITQPPSVEGVVLPLTQIRQGCMLFPDFKDGLVDDWETDNVLDEAYSFYVNNWQSKYSYQTLW